MNNPETTNSLEIMRRHLGKVEEVELEDGEKIKIAPLPAEFMPEFLVAQIKLEDKEITVKTLVTMEICIKESLKAANPKSPEMTEAEYEKLIKDFTMRYYFPLLNKVADINRAGLTDKDLNEITKMHEKIEKVRDARASKTPNKGDTDKNKTD